MTGEVFQYGLLPPSHTQSKLLSCPPLSLSHSAQQGLQSAEPAQKSPPRSWEWPYKQLRSQGSCFPVSSTGNRTLTFTGSPRAPVSVSAGSQRPWNAATSNTKARFHSPPAYLGCLTLEEGEGGVLRGYGGEALHGYHGHLCGYSFQLYPL